MQLQSSLLTALTVTRGWWSLGITSGLDAQSLTSQKPLVFQLATTSLQQYELCWFTSERLLTHQKALFSPLVMQQQLSTSCVQYLPGHTANTYPALWFRDLPTNSGAESDLVSLICLEIAFNLYGLRQKSSDGIMQTENTGALYW